MTSVLEQIIEAKRSGATRLYLTDLRGAAALPPAIGELEQLLDLTIANIHSIPEEIGNLQRLQHLIISTDGALPPLPDSFCRLQQLKSLAFISKTDFILPAATTRLSALERFETHAPSITLPPELGGLAALRSFSTYGKLSSLPEDIGDLQRLALVTLRCGDLRQLPSSITRLRALQSLDVCWNCIERLPDALGDMVGLQELRCEGNRISHLPRSIGRLRALEILDLSKNRLEEVPTDIEQLTALRVLALPHNRLRSLPQEVCLLRSLARLDLTANQLTSLPEQIGRLSSLESLQLLGNKVEFLPRSAVHLRALKNLELCDEQPPLLPVASFTRQWDIFISYSSSDRASVAVPLAEHLRQSGLRVWLDQEEIRLGDSIHSKLNDGLARSRFGVLILSPAFFESEWTKRELGGLLALEEAGQRVILPVWHGVKKQDVVAYSPMLGDLMAVDTEQGIFEVAGKIVDCVLYGTEDAPSALFPTLTRQIVELICLQQDAQRLRDFVLHHGALMEHAFSCFSNGFKTEATTDLSDWPVFVAVSRQRSAGTSVRSYVLLGPFDTSIFDAAFQPIPELAACITSMHEAHSRHPMPERLSPERRRLLRSAELRHYWGFHARTLIGHDQPSVIVAGRRHALGPVEQHALNELNAVLAGDGIRVRSYDWLIEATRVWERSRWQFNR